MKLRILLALAACAVSAAATAQMPPPHPRGPGMDRPHMSPPHRPQRRHKVWVPAHREHGRRVPGHYVWR